ncbi:hypothetical protein NRP93_000436 [Clostridium botulinum]|nr:hypothetical protein [Clostridium botulinum]
MNKKTSTFKINTKDKIFELDGNDVSKKINSLEIKIVAGDIPNIKLNFDADIEFEGTIYPTLSRVYCEKCNKLLGELAGNYEVICPKCKELNVGHC